MAFVCCHGICITVLVFPLFSLPHFPLSSCFPSSHSAHLHSSLCFFFFFFVFFPRLSFFIAGPFSAPSRISPFLWCVARHRVWTPGLRWMTPSATGSWTSPVFHPGWQERTTFSRASSTKSLVPKRSIIRAKVSRTCSTRSLAYALIPVHQPWFQTSHYRIWTLHYSFFLH